MKDLFADVVLTPSQTGQYYPHKCRCNVCWQYFETTIRNAKQCNKHYGMKETKLLQRVYTKNDLPFKNYNRTKKCYE